MSQAVYPISDVINVTVAGTPVGLSTPNVNSVGLLTTDAPINGEAYGIYFSPQQVGANYGTTTDTYLMAVNMFAQLPNLLSGNGQLVIAQAQGVTQAAHGNFVSANLTANLAALIAVNNGSVNLVIDGVVVALTGMNFTSCTTLAQIAAVMSAAMPNPDAVISATPAANPTGLTFTSKKVGAASSIGLTANNTGTSLVGANLLNVAAGVAAAGTNMTGESIPATIQRVLPQTFFAGVITTYDYEDAAAQAAAAFVNSIDMILYIPRAQTKDIAGLATLIQQASQKKARVLVYCTGTMHDAKLYAAAYVGAAHSVDFTGSNTTITMNLKSLVNVLPDVGLTETFRIAAQAAGADLYLSYSGVPGVASNGGNVFFDNVYNDLALKFDLQTAGFNYLKQVSTKIPQTEPGMYGWKDRYRQVMDQYVRNGALAPGSWTSPNTFGDPVTFVNNITAKGYYIYSLPVAQQATPQRQGRIAPLVQIAGKRAGAFHSGNVLVNIND